MIALLSPAKSLDFTIDEPVKDSSTPALLEDARYLIGKLQKVGPVKIKKMMSISSDLANLNYDRFQNWTGDEDQNRTKSALLAFRGDVYRGMGADDFDEKDLQFAQQHLRILSGLYGLLRPLDRIEPYRLEMGCSFKVTSAKNNLYKYWDDRITDEINSSLAESGNKVVLNLASAEYFKAVNVKAIKGELVDAIFMDEKGGEYKVVMTWAKLARGMMARHIVQNRINDLEELKGFNSDGYVYNDALSEPGKMIFTRDH